MDRIRQVYKRREGRLAPFPWCDDLNFNLNDIFTQLKIVNKEKTRGTLTDDEITNMTGIFRPHPECQKPRIVLIEGDPGIGKTTYSQKLALDWANQQDQWDASFPAIELLLLLRCNDVKSSIWEAIDDQILPDDIDEQAKESFFKYIRENQSKVLLLLDGLDEADPCKLDMYNSLVKSKLLPDCQIVITSRHEVGKKVRPYCDTIFEIVGFTEEDAKSFIRKYFHGKEHLAEKLIERLKLIWYPTEFTKNPLNTALLCCLFEDFGGVLPTSRTQLYVEIVLFVLRRYEEKNKLPSSNTDLISVYKKKLILLGSFALESLVKGELYFEKTEETFKSINFGFLSFQQGGSKRQPCMRCAFLHKSFQEFFAGFYLAFQIIDKEIDSGQVVRDDRYLDKLREVFLFMSGIIASQSQETAVSFVIGITGHINCLLRTPDKEVTSYMKLACECLSECSSLEESLETRLVCAMGDHLDVSSLTDLDLSGSRVRDAGAAAISKSLTANSSLTTLCLGENSIADVGASCLSQTLTANSSLKSLDLNRNSIGDAGAFCLFQALTANSSLTTLNLSHNSIGDAGASCLSQALTASSSLIALDLNGNSIGDASAFCLFKGLTANSSLTTLNLSHNSIGGAGTSCLSQALTANSSLTTLHLSFNSIGDTGASRLSQALKGNSSVSILNLSGNGIGNAGASCFSQALGANSSLTALYFRANSIGDDGVFYLSQALRENSSLTTLDLSRNSIGDSGASRLSQALESNSCLTTLNLSHNSISDAGASCFSQALTANSSLTTLLLSFNSIGDTGASCLSQAIAANSSLTTLNLSGNSVGHIGASCFSQALTANSSLTNFSLSGNGIGDAGASCVSQALAANSSLATLTLKFNGIGEDGASCLSNALTANSSLTTMDLSGNCIGDAGASRLSQALKANSSLTTLDLSDNSIGDSGASRLSQALTVNSSLTNLYLNSNRFGCAGATSLNEALKMNKIVHVFYYKK